MYSEDVKVVFGFEPSGLFENVILAPEIGTPRTLSPLGPCDDESEFEGVTGSVFVGVAGASFLGTFGILIFGIENCAVAGAAKNEVTAMAAIRISDDDLFIKIFLSKVKFGSKVTKV
jgi:hypothetical protein